MEKFTITAANKPYPCYDCKDRHVKCHAECERYLKHKETIDKANHSRDSWNKRLYFTKGD